MADVTSNSTSASSCAAAGHLAALNLLSIPNTRVISALPNPMQSGICFRQVQTLGAEQAPVSECAEGLGMFASLVESL